MAIQSCINLFARIQLNRLSAAVGFLWFFATVFSLESQGQVANPPKMVGNRLLKLEEIIALAQQQNAGLRAAELELEAQRSLRNAAVDLGKTEINAEYGQINTRNNDTKFNISQRFPFPTTFARQAGLTREAIKQSEMQQVRTGQELVYEVKKAYYQLVYYRQLGELLQRQDSLYSLFVQAEEKRFQTGDAYELEKATAESQLMHVRNQISEDDADQQVWRARLQTLLNTTQTVWIKLPDLLKRPLTFVPDTVALRQTPAWNLATQQLAVQQKMYSLEKARMLPDLTFGYFNQSFVGEIDILRQERVNTGRDRFDGFTAGIALPLWWKPYAARIQSARFRTKQAEKLALQEHYNLRGNLNHALQVFEKEKNALLYYEQTALKQSDLVINLSNKSFRAGEVGYVEYLQSVRSALEIKSSYLERLLRYNLSVVELEFICGQL